MNKHNEQPPRAKITILFLLALLIAAAVIPSSSAASEYKPQLSIGPTLGNFIVSATYDYDTTRSGSCYGAELSGTLLFFNGALSVRNWERPAESGQTLDATLYLGVGIGSAIHIQAGIPLDFRMENTSLRIKTEWAIDRNDGTAGFGEGVAFDIHVEISEERISVGFGIGLGTWGSSLF